MKHFLKSTVSVFVLLSALSTLTPSQAVEEEENLPYSQRRIPKDVAHLLTPIEERHL